MGRDWSDGPAVNDGRGLVGEHTLAELRRLDAGGWHDPRFAGQRIPTLDEVLGWARGRTRLAIEIKNGPIFYAGIEATIVDLLARRGMRERAPDPSRPVNALPPAAGIAPA